MAPIPLQLLHLLLLLIAFFPLSSLSKSNPYTLISSTNENVQSLNATLPLTVQSSATLTFSSPSIFSTFTLSTYSTLNANDLVTFNIELVCDSGVLNHKSNVIVHGDAVIGQPYCCPNSCDIYGNSVNATTMSVDGTISWITGW